MIESVRRQRRKSLTDKMVSKLPRRAAPYFNPDPEMPSHGVRVRPNGPPSYYVITRDPYGKQRWVKVGSSATLTIEESREIARSVIKRLKAGDDPFPPPKVRPDSVADVVANWLKRHVDKNGLRSAAEIRRTLNKYILPHWSDRSFADIKRSDVAKLLDHVEDKHGPFVADAALTMLGSIATWFASRHDTYVPPFTRGMRRVSTASRKRSRKLSDNELRSIWRAAETAGVYGAIVKTLLLTAQRRAKVVTMKWTDLSPDGTWTLPAAPREKTNPGNLRLSKQALAIIHAQPRFVGSDRVFGRFSNFGRAKERLDSACGVRGWTVHDLRRTARSLMSRAKVRPDISERVLGHTIRGVEGVYDVFEYTSEKADALHRLANLIERIVDGPADNVVPLHEAHS